MALEVIVYGGGDKVVDYLNAVASIVQSNSYALAVFAAGLFSLFIIIINYFNTYKLELQKIILTLILGFTLLEISTSVIVIDKRNIGENNTVDNIPILLAIPMSFSSQIAYYLIKTFQTAYSTPTGENIYGYPDKGSMYLPKLLKAHLNTTLPDNIYKANLIKYIKRCVAPRITTAGEQSLYAAPDVMAELYKYVSNIWSINDWCEDDGTGKCGSIVSVTCLQAYNWLSANRENITNAAILKTIKANQLPVSTSEIGTLSTLYKNHLAEAYNRFLGVAGINQSTTILNAAITNILTDGFEAYAIQTGNNPYLLSLAIAQAREADNMNLATWAVIASEKLSFFKEYMYLILISISPIVFVIGIISGFHRLILTYFLMLLWISFWDVANVVTEALQYHYLENLKDVIDASGLIGSQIQNITNYSSDVLRILNKQIVFAGFLSATVSPTLAGAIVFGLDKLTGFVTSSLGFGQQAATQAGTSLARGDISLGNQNILNKSIANENDFNTAKHTWRSWTFDSNSVNLNNASMFSRAGSTEALLNTGAGMNIDITTGLDIATQTNAIKQHSRQALENAINQFTSNKIVRDTFNTAFTHALNKFKNFSENNLSNYTQSEIDSYKIAKDFIKKYGYSESDTYKYAAAIETIKNTIKEFGFKGEFDTRVIPVIGQILEKFGLSAEFYGKVGQNKINRGATKESSGHTETIVKDTISNLANYLAHDKSFQKQLTEQFSSADGVSANSATSTAHIFAGSKEFQNARQKLFQALESFSKIQNISDSIRKSSGYGIKRTINTLNYAKEYAGQIFSIAEASTLSIKNGKGSIYDKATYNLVKSVLHTDNVDDTLQKLSKLKNEYYGGNESQKFSSIRTAQRLIEAAAIGQSIDGKLNDNEIALANFFGYTDILDKQEQMIESYNSLKSQFTDDGKFHNIENKVGNINEDQIKNKVDSGWNKSVALHETKEDKVREYTYRNDGTSRLYGDFGYDKKEQEKWTEWEHKKSYDINEWKAHLEDQNRTLKTEKDLKKINPDLETIDETAIRKIKNIFK